VSDTDFAALAEPVAKHFWGDPNPSLSSKTCLRWGSGGSRSLELAKGAWYDHEAAEGGGVIDLVTRETGADKAGAIEWMQTEGFILPREGHTATQPRQERQEAGPSPTEPPDEAGPPDDAPQGKMKPVKGYRYTDRDGNPLYEVIRYQWELPDGSFVIDPKTGNPKKTFRQRRKVGSDYVYNLDGIGHTIYRHPEVEIAVAEGRVVYLVEGEKDVETLESWGLVASTNSGGAQHWSPAHAELFRDADVVILLDNDDAGRSGGLKRAQSLRGIAKRVRVLDFAQHIPDFPAKLDVTDWKDRFGGTSDQLEKIIAGLPDWRSAPPISKFGAVGLDQLHLPHLKHEYLIDGFLDRHCVAMMPGASGSGKTFLVLEMAMCVALGRDFWGMKTKPGLVLYQAGEGKEGVTKRLDGWMLDRGVDPSAEVPFKMLTRKINLFVDDKDTDDLIEEGKAWSEYYGLPVRMLIIDTLNKAMTGANENAGQDMSKIIARAERISDALDCAVPILLHKGKSGEIRGHTSQTGDVANVINVTELGTKESPFRDRNGRSIRTATLDKNKDGEGGRPMRFVLRQMVLGADETGKPITTCVVDRPDGDEASLVAEGKLSLNQTIFLQTLKDSIDIDGIDPPVTVTGVPYGKRVVTWKLFNERLRNKWPFTAAEHEVEKRNKEFERSVGDAGKRLVAYGYVERDNKEKLIWWTGKSDKPKVQKAPEPPKPSPLMTPEDDKVPF
jgi:hypothetical protein